MNLTPVDDPRNVYYLKKRLFRLLRITRDINAFPGSQPVTFMREHLDWLLNEDYYVCEKSDGTRYLLYYTYFNADGVGVNKGFLIDRNYEFWELPAPARIPLKAGRASRQDKWHRDVLLDGELIGEDDHPRFCIFDLLMVYGESVCDCSLPRRLQLLQNDILVPLSTARPEGDLRLVMKEMHKPYGMQLVFEKIARQTHGNDGLIFTPVQAHYTAGTTPSL